MASRTRRPPEAAEPTSSLEDRVTTLETQMEKVLQTPAVRKRTPLGVCALGVTPSEACKEASLGKYQSGCHGDACRARQAEYFREWRARSKADAAANVVKTPTKRAPARPKAVKVDTPVKRAVKRRPAPEPAPAKRAVKRKRA